MKNLDNLTKKELLKLIVKRLDNLAEKEQLKEQIKLLKDTVKSLENRISILEAFKPLSWPNNLPNITWYDNPNITRYDNPNAPWVPQVFGDSKITSNSAVENSSNSTSNLDEATKQLKESVFNIDLHLNKTKKS